MKNNKRKLIVKSDVGQYLKNAKAADMDLNQRKGEIALKVNSQRMYDSFYDKRN